MITKSNGRNVIQCTLGQFYTLWVNFAYYRTVHCKSYICQSVTNNKRDKWLMLNFMAALLATAERVQKHYRERRTEREEVVWASLLGLSHKSQKSNKSQLYYVNLKAIFSSTDMYV